jgi:excisionase family DNA binding protein
MFFTTKQAAARLNLPVSTLRRHLREGAIRAGRRPGQTIYVFSEKQLKDAERLFEEGFIDAEIAETPNNHRAI